MSDNQRLEGDRATSGKIIDLKRGERAFEQYFADVIRDEPDEPGDEPYEWPNKAAEKYRERIFGVGTKREDVKLLAAIPLMYQGWECDEWGWVVEYQGKPVLVMTDHGSPSIMDAEELRDFILRYSEGIQLVVKALIKLGREDIVGMVKGDRADG
jgi:hypothetical protein